MDKEQKQRDCQEEEQGKGHKEVQKKVREEVQEEVQHSGADQAGQRPSLEQERLLRQARLRDETPEPYIQRTNETYEELLSLTEHLTELRRRVIWVLLVLVGTLIGGLYAAAPVYRYLLTKRFPSDLELNALSVWDGISIYVKISFIFAIGATLPFALYQLWRFVGPGLRQQERSAALRYIPYVFLLFIGGGLFAYGVIYPMALAFTTSVNRSMGLQETYGVMQYFEFLFNLILPVALLFELPLVIMFLTAIRILNPSRLRKVRRFAYFGLVFIAVVITPPDLVSDLLVTVPLLLLYEGSIFVSSLVYRRQQREDEERDENIKRNKEQ
ncbi:Sec-independent protein translocase protein TatCy [compost metagenome]